MRTTVTLDEDVAVKLKELAHRKRTSFKAMLNETLRRGLGAQTLACETPRFSVEPHAGGFRPGVDPAKLNQSLDELEAEDFTTEADGTEGTP